MRFWPVFAVLTVSCGSPPAPTPVVQGPASQPTAAAGTKRIARDGEALYCRMAHGCPQMRGAVSRSRTASMLLRWRTVSCFRRVRNVRRTTRGDTSPLTTPQII